MRLRLVIAVTTFVCALVGAPGAFAASSDLFISEYVEGSSNNKALEIFNDTGVPVDLAAGAYNVQMFSNGSTSPSVTINLTGTVADDDVFVLAHSSAVLPMVPDQTNGAGWFNGNDAVVLRKGTTVLDAIGQIGFDPGTEWGTGLTSTADNTLRRKSTIVAGDPTGSDAFDPAGQWDGFAQNTFDGLGAHTVVGDAPFVAATTPASGAADVLTASDIEITFSEPVTVAGATFSISCAVSGAHAFALSGGPTTYTLDPAGALALGERCTVTVDDAGVSDVDTDDPPDTMTADHVFSFTTVPLPARIFEIQGAAHVSPLDARVVSGVAGVVTVVRPNSFTMQDALGDANDATSDAILVFGTGIGGSVSIGQAVTVAGVVSEFRPGGVATNLTTTEIVSPVVTPGGPGARISATVLGLDGRTPPTTVIDDDATGDVETSGTFDPATDGIDFYESLEAMLLRVDDPVVVGPTNQRGETLGARRRRRGSERPNGTRRASSSARPISIPSASSSTTRSSWTRRPTRTSATASPRERSACSTTTSAASSSCSRVPSPGSTAGSSAR